MDKQIVVELIRRGKKADKGYFAFAHIVAILFDSRLHEQLDQIVNGPIWDGDVISKSCRDELFDYGLAVRVCVNGEQGYTGATYFAYTVNKKIKAIRSGEIAA